MGLTQFSKNSPRDIFDTNRTKKDSRFINIVAQKYHRPSVFQKWLHCFPVALRRFGDHLQAIIAPFFRMIECYFTAAASVTPFWAFSNFFSSSPQNISPWGNKFPSVGHAKADPSTVNRKFARAGHRTKVNKDKIEISLGCSCYTRINLLIQLQVADRQTWHLCQQ